MAETTTPPATGWRWTPARIVLAVVVAALVAMWGYILYLAIGPGRQDPPGRLDEPAFALAAQERCDAALDAIALLPAASTVHSADERADTIQAANIELDAMLGDLAAIEPGGDDGDHVREWIDDWRTYLADRAAYAETVRSDPEAPFFVSIKGNDQITEHIDAFAADNHMPACGTPTDV